MIEVDPAVSGFGAAPDFSKVPKADVVLITDIHDDHLDPASLAKVRKQGTTVVIPGAAASKVPDADRVASDQLVPTALLPFGAKSGVPLPAASSLIVPAGMSATFNDVGPPSVLNSR